MHPDLNIFAMANTTMLPVHYKRALILATHEHATQTWGGQPYYVHLEAVEEVLIRFGYANASSEKGITFSIVAWLHDILEDGALSFNDLKKEFGEPVAEAVYALTEEKGRNRKERKPPHHYEAIRNNPLACIVKLADRIANCEQAQRSESRMLAVYREEYPLFREKLCVPGMADDLWEHLHGLLFTEN